MFSSQSKRYGVFPWHIRMETARELNGAYSTEGGWFSLSFYVLCCYGIEAIPGVNMGDWGRRERGTRQSLNSKAEGEESLFLDQYKLTWLVDSGLCAVMSRKHMGAFSLQKKRFETPW